MRRATAASLAVAGYDQGMVFVRGDERHPGARPVRRARPRRGPQVTDGRVTDVRNRVILAEEPVPRTPLPAPLADGTWRVVAAASAATRC